MSRVILVERALTPDDEAKRVQLDRCLQVREVVRLHTFRATDGGAEIAVFDALDTERVRESHRSAGVEFLRAWPAEVV